jgi:hypothetical protein
MRGSFFTAWHRAAKACDLYFEAFLFAGDLSKIGVHKSFLRHQSSISIFQVSKDALEVRRGGSNLLELLKKTFDFKGKVSKVDAEEARAGCKKKVAASIHQRNER